jgi:hypothetical protein
MNKVLPLSLLAITCVIFLGACATETASPQPFAQATMMPSATARPTTTPLATSDDAVLQTATSVPLNPAEWREWPVIPTLSPEMLTVYARGQGLGRDPHVVSVIGDCESSSEWFLKDFAKGERYYSLGPYESLQETIDYYNPSLGSNSYAAIRGATVSTVLATLWADKSCLANETPISCEYRVRNPALVFVALGTNDVHRSENFEPKMREIIEYTLEQGIIPIMVTKADNLEGNDSINASIAGLAAEYHLPLLNFWAAVQPLPDAGLQEDGAHLTFAGNYFDDPAALKKAWPIRNLTALQTLEMVRLTLEENQK